MFKVLYASIFECAFLIVTNLARNSSLKTVCHILQGSNICEDMRKLRMTHSTFNVLNKLQYSKTRKYKAKYLCCNFQKTVCTTAEFRQAFCVHRWPKSRMYGSCRNLSKSFDFNKKNILILRMMHKKTKIVE